MYQLKVKISIAAMKYEKLICRIIKLKIHVILDECKVDKKYKTKKNIREMSTNLNGYTS